MEYCLSPKYDHSKLDNPTVDDLIDVFEDLWIGYVFSPVEMLLNNQYGHVAAATLLSSYFEAIESHYAGESSEKNHVNSLLRGFAACSRQISQELNQPQIIYTSMFGAAWYMKVC
ncbi:hypothetical protein [Halomonas salipaludis]|uniref:hypothetical protein n=1 Tax=Halomonas salipaludis TaxID=2032625 RepID=UPI001140CEAA|nr:hypothetical protein [Halomonas salipaludis]